MHFIYKITNQVNKKIYIGQTVKPKTRWVQHKSQANTLSRKGRAYHLYFSMNKYGIDNFTFEIIDCALDQHQADCIEYNLINSYNSCDDNIGYNKKTGGQGKNSKGHPWTEEQKKNHSEFMKVNPNSGQITSERMLGNQINLGRKHSDEVNKSKGRKGGTSTSFKPGFGWKLENGKRIYYKKD